MCKGEFIMLEEVTIYTDGACSGNPGPRWLWRYFDAR